MEAILNNRHRDGHRDYHDKDGDGGGIINETAHV